MIVNMNFCSEYQVSALRPRHLSTESTCDVVMYSRKPRLITNHEVMPTISFGSMQEGQHDLRILHSFLAQPDCQQMWHPMQMERSEANGVMQKS
jgi:hypothetical protein